MNSRNFVERVALTTGTALAAATSQAAEAATSSASGGFDVAEKTVAQLQTALRAGTINSQQLVQLYLARITALDKSGATGVRGEAEKREIAGAWLELALSCAKVSVKYDAEELKQMDQQKQAPEMEMG